jgi:hypothetical protein
MGEGIHSLNEPLEKCSIQNVAIRNYSRWYVAVADGSTKI